MKASEVIVLGDSFNNTLGLIRSLGRARARVTLLLVGHDRLFVSKSRYIDVCHRFETLESVIPFLRDYNAGNPKPFLICSNDPAAEIVDANETWLSEKFVTPMRGYRIGELFNKETQCRLAEEYDITIPRSIVIKRDCRVKSPFPYPVLIKPNESVNGSKSDIHICRSETDLRNALDEDSNCDSFILQEYIEKEFELNFIGVANESDILIPGVIKKLRHYPNGCGPCSFGEYIPRDNNSEKRLGSTPPWSELESFVKATGYHGPFSIEMLYKNGKFYFMEINMRHDGLAYTVTAAGRNLLAEYLGTSNRSKLPRHIYMMDLSIDYCHVQKGEISKWTWLKDFFRQGCQLNFNWNDMRPTLAYYKSKFSGR